MRLKSVLVTVALAEQDKSRDIRIEWGENEEGEVDEKVALRPLPYERYTHEELEKLLSEMARVQVLATRLKDEVASYAGGDRG